MQEREGGGDRSEDAGSVVLRAYAMGLWRRVGDNFPGRRFYARRSGWRDLWNVRSGAADTERPPILGSGSQPSISVGADAEAASAKATPGFGGSLPGAVLPREEGPRVAAREPGGSAKLPLQDAGRRAC